MPGMLGDTAGGQHDGGGSGGDGSGGASGRSGRGVDLLQRLPLLLTAPHRNTSAANQGEGEDEGEDEDEGEGEGEGGDALLQRLLLVVRIEASALAADPKHR
jgi:hypothetical protein